jgi:hypothetical protein
MGAPLLLLMQGFPHTLSGVAYWHTFASYHTC